MAETTQGPASKEWQQTIVAANPPPEEPVPEAPLEPAPELEPAPVEAAPEPAPLEPLTPPEEISDAPGPRIPEVWQPYVRSEQSSMVLKQPFLAPETKAELERAFSHRGVRLRERRWLPYKSETERDVGAAVDAYQWAPKYEPKAASWLARQAAARRRALQGLERVPANITKKRIVFETEGGFVVEVTYRELGQSKTKFFTIPAAGDHAKVLKLVKSGTYQVATVVTAELVNLLAQSMPKARRPAPAGKIRTWPIRNRHPVKALGLPSTATRRLARMGIRTTDQLRVHPTAVVARKLGVAAAKVHAWQRSSQLLLIKGMTPSYARMLGAADVGLDEIRRHTPASLSQLVNLSLGSQKKSRLTPITKAKAGSWIRAAKKLRRTPQAFPK